jgi:hypothetical protein
MSAIRDAQVWTSDLSSGMSRDAGNQSKDFADNAGSVGFALIACPDARLGRRPTSR